MVPDPRVELGTPASSGQRSTDELARHVLCKFLFYTNLQRSGGNAKRSYHHAKRGGR